MTDSPRLLHDVLTMTPASRPDAPAVEGEHGTWSYAEIDRASSSLAAVLLAMGVLPGDRVAVCRRKSPEIVASIFGILKAGAVFVPLDPSAPAGRLGAIVNDCRPKVIVGGGRKLHDLLACLAAPRPSVIEIAEEAAPSPPAPSDEKVIPWRAVMATPPLDVAVSRRSSDVAYILYTSGSTGAPKGVMITHENALAFTSWACRTFGVAPGDRVPSVAPFHFDLSTFDLYSTLEAGATVVLVPEENTLFPNSLAAFLESRRVTMAYLTPSVITGMLLHGDLRSRKLGSLRTILFAGEVFPPRYLSLLMEAVPGAELYNLYGPTETNVCTWYEVRAEDRFREQPVPIGAPASRDVVFALDDQGEVVTEPGREGELYVAGPTVAAGYWGDEERTGRLFLPGHAKAPAGTRVYRTGDRVSLDAEGRWLYHGRRDHMVKSRGYRIELGDIEAALYAHPLVAEAVAIAVADEEIGSRIKVVVAPKAGARLDAAAVQRHCASKLPRYMVPEIVEFMPALPKTSSGKIDRMRLKGEDPLHNPR